MDIDLNLLMDFANSASAIVNSNNINSNNIPTKVPNITQQKPIQQKPIQQKLIQQKPIQQKPIQQKTNPITPLQQKTKTVTSTNVSNLPVNIPTNAPINAIFQPRHTIELPTEWECLNIQIPEDDIDEATSKLFYKHSHHQTSNINKYSKFQAHLLQKVFIHALCHRIQCYQKMGYQISIPRADEYAKQLMKQIMSPAGVHANVHANVPSALSLQVIPNGGKTSVLFNMSMLCMVAANQCALGGYGIQQPPIIIMVCPDKKSMDDYAERAFEVKKPYKHPKSETRVQTQLADQHMIKLVGISAILAQGNKLQGDTKQQKFIDNLTTFLDRSVAKDVVIIFAIPNHLSANSVLWRFTEEQSKMAHPNLIGVIFDEMSPAVLIKSDVENRMNTTAKHISTYNQLLTRFKLPPFVVMLQPELGLSELTVTVQVPRDDHVGATDNYAYDDYDDDDNGEDDELSSPRTSQNVAQKRRPSTTKQMPMMAYLTSNQHYKILHLEQLRYDHGGGEIVKQLLPMPNPFLAKKMLRDTMLYVKRVCQLLDENKTDVIPVYMESISRNLICGILPPRGLCSVLNSSPKHQIHLLKDHVHANRKLLFYLAECIYTYTSTWSKPSTEVDRLVDECIGVLNNSSNNVQNGELIVCQGCGKMEHMERLLCAAEQAIQLVKDCERFTLATNDTPLDSDALFRIKAKDVIAMAFEFNSNPTETTSILLAYLYPTIAPASECGTQTKEQKEQYCACCLHQKDHEAADELCYLYNLPERSSNFHLRWLLHTFNSADTLGVVHTWLEGGPYLAIARQIASDLFVTPQKYQNQVKNPSCMPTPSGIILPDEWSMDFFQYMLRVVGLPRSKMVRYRDARSNTEYKELWKEYEEDCGFRPVLLSNSDTNNMTNITNVLATYLITPPLYHQSRSSQQPNYQPNNQTNYQKNDENKVNRKQGSSSTINHIIYTWPVPDQAQLTRMSSVSEDQMIYELLSNPCNYYLSSCSAFPLLTYRNVLNANRQIVISSAISQLRDYVYSSSFFADHRVQAIGIDRVVQDDVAAIRWWSSPSLSSVSSSLSTSSTINDGICMGFDGITEFGKMLLNQREERNNEKVRVKIAKQEAQDERNKKPAPRKRGRPAGSKNRKSNKYNDADAALLQAMLDEQHEKITMIVEEWNRGNITKDEYDRQERSIVTEYIAKMDTIGKKIPKIVPLSISSSIYE